MAYRWGRNGRKLIFFHKKKRNKKVLKKLETPKSQRLERLSPCTALFVMHLLNLLTQCVRRWGFWEALQRDTARSPASRGFRLAILGGWWGGARGAKEEEKQQEEEQFCTNSFKLVGWIHHLQASRWKEHAKEQPSKMVQTESFTWVDIPCTMSRVTNYCVFRCF